MGGTSALPSIYSASQHAEYSRLKMVG